MLDPKGKRRKCCPPKATHLTLLPPSSLLLALAIGQTQPETQEKGAHCTTHTSQLLRSQREQGQTEDTQPS